MTTSILTDLRTIGLHKNEVEIYLYLLSNGLSSPPPIAKGTGILRTNCYNVIRELKEKDLIEEQKRGARRVYIARDPQSLKLSLARKLESVDRMLPDLRALYTTQKNKPSFRFFEGFEEVKEIYELVTKTESVYSTGSTERLHDLDPQFFESFVNKIEKNKVMFKDILTGASKKYSAALIKQMRGALHEIKFLPDQYKENLTDLLVWEDNIALIALDEPIFGTIITNPPLVSTFKILLQIIWDKI